MLRTLQENGKIFAVIPLQEYEKLSELAEMAKEIAAYEQAKARNEEAFPIWLYDAIEAGENPVRLFREYRKITLKNLAKKAGLSEAFVCQIEAGSRKGSAKSLKAIADALSVSVDNLIL